MPLVVVAARGRVAPGDNLAVDLSGDGDVLADGDAEDVVGAGESEAVPRICKTRLSFSFSRLPEGASYNAVLGEMTTFSTSG